jgi:hypothetical protein
MQLFRREEKPLIGATKLDQKNNNTSALFWPFWKTDV